MKFLVALILSASLSTFAQETDTITESKPKYQDYHKRAVIIVNGNNLVYRGIENKITVAVAGVDAWDTMVSGPGTLRKTGGLGEFSWNVTSLKERFAKITVSYRLPDGSSKQEQREFEIRDIKPFTSLINGNGDYNCIVQQTLEQLKDAKISVVCDDDLHQYGLRHIYVKGFEIQIDNRTFSVIGDKITDEVYNEIKKLKKGSIFNIKRIEIVTSAYGIKIADIKVMIVDN